MGFYSGRFFLLTGMLFVVKLSVIMLRVVMLSDVAPTEVPLSFGIIRIIDIDV